MAQYLANVAHTMSRWLLAAAISMLLAGCASQPLKAWEKGYLAKPGMGWSQHANDSAFDAHVKFSKEASTGAAGTAGGGCGCN